MKKSFYFSFRFKTFISYVILISVLTVSVFGVGLYFYKTSNAVLKDEILSYENLVIIDAGHGGQDSGTSTSLGVPEKKINLEISEKIDDFLVLLGYDTIMVRTEDNLICDEGIDTVRGRKVSDINNRMKIMKSYPDSLFLSIHQNYFNESKYYGAQVFYSANNPKSEVLAELIQNSIKTNIQNDNERTIKKSGNEIYLLHNTDNIAVMVECGFLSNPSEALKLQSEEYQSLMAFAIAKGIRDFYKM